MHYISTQVFIMNLLLCFSLLTIKFLIFCSAWINHCIIINSRNKLADRLFLCYKSLNLSAVPFLSKVLVYLLPSNGSSFPVPSISLASDGIDSGLSCEAVYTVWIGGQMGSCDMVRSELCLRIEHQSSIRSPVKKSSEVGPCRALMVLQQNSSNNNNNKKKKNTNTNIWKYIMI